MYFVNIQGRGCMVYFSQAKGKDKENKIRESAPCGRGRVVLRKPDKIPTRWE